MNLKHLITHWSVKKSKKLSRKGLYEFLASAYEQIPHQATVLTIGAGGGVNSLLAEYAIKHNLTVRSFDIDADRKPDIVGDICTHDFGTQKFDCIIMSEVLEHVHAPHLAIETIYHALTENGRLILTTPFAFPLHDRPYDYFRYTKYGLAHLLQSFENVSIQARNSYFDAIDVLWVRLWREEHQEARLAAYIIIPIVYYLKRPFTWLLSKLIKADGLTTGYVVIANK